jgi:hypothetical protein
MLDRLPYMTPTFGKGQQKPKSPLCHAAYCFKIVNAAGFEITNGLTPDYIKEITEFDILGNSTEPLLSTAIGKITGTGKMLKQSPDKDFNYFSDTKSLNGIQNQMYLEKHLKVS